MLTKMCSKCSRERGLDLFANNSKGKYGKRGICRECTSTSAKKRREDNADKLNADARDRYSKNREKVLARCAKYREENIDKVLERGRVYRENNAEKERVRGLNKYYANKEAYFENSARRRATQKNQTPFLSRESVDKMRAKYELAQILYEATGVKHHVDHVVSLKEGGAHHWANLSVITAKQNRKKSSKSDWEDGVHYSAFCAYA